MLKQVEASWSQRECSQRLRLRRRNEDCWRTKWQPWPFPEGLFGHCGIDALFATAFKSVLVDTALRFNFLMVSTCFNTLTFQYILIPIGTVCPNHDAGGFRLEELVKQKECPHSVAGRTDKILCLHSLLSNNKGFCQVASDKLSASPLAYPRSWPGLWTCLALPLHNLRRILRFLWKLVV